MPRKPTQPPATHTRPDSAERPGAPDLPPPGGLTDENTPPADDNDRPQADPEVPALGEWERRRGQFPTDESTGVEPPDTDG